MKASWIPTVVPTCLAVIGLLLLTLWIGSAGRATIEARGPGLDGTPPAAVQQTDQRPSVAGEPILGDGRPAGIPGAWPAFRGPNRDGICDDGTPLARTWPTEGPPLVWQIDVEEGVRRCGNPGRPRLRSGL